MRSARHPRARLSWSSSLAAGCGDSDSSGDGGAVVVGTTTQVGDLLREVGGRRADVRQILRPNSDPHDYEPRPSDVKALSDAKLVVRSGGDVDDWLDGLVDNAGSDAPVLDLIDDRADAPAGRRPGPALVAGPAERRAGRGGDPRPPRGGRSGAGARAYRRNAARYLARLAAPRPRHRRVHRPHPGRRGASS